MKIEIDKHSGFCFGVRNAINKAEEILASGEKLHCLGDIVHNHEEVNRLKLLGMKTISMDENQHNATVLIRSHGEPPSTYNKLTKNGNKVVDATCPVVLKLQSRVKKSFENISEAGGQLVIFGKHGHPEVLGLNGQTGQKAIVVAELSDLAQLDYHKPIELYCQTTMSLDLFAVISAEIRKQAHAEVLIHDTICRQVSNRVPRMKEFSSQFDAVLFVSGKKSLNGKFLFEVCKKVNAKTYFIASPEELNPEWFVNVNSIGICGATSTPMWLMEDIKHMAESITNHK